MSAPVHTQHHDVYPAIDPQGALQGSCSGKRVCILGASQGCGQAMAVSYAQAGAAELFLTARSTSSLADTLKAVNEASSSTNVRTYALNLQQPAASEVLQTILKDSGGELDVLVTNAGVLEEWKPLADSDPDEWWGSWEVNVRGTYLAASQYGGLHRLEDTRALPMMFAPSKLPLARRTAIRSWLENKRGGTIILITSAGSLRARPGASAYQSTKLAINRLAQFIDADHGQQGIRAFAIHPGGVPTKLAYGMPKDMHAILVDTPQLSGGMCVYLSSSRADFLRGRYISSTWDVTELEARKQEILDKNLLKMQLAL